jgi:glucose/arabinose dehydrogenase
MARRSYLLLALLTVACGRTPPPTPSTGGGTGPTETITGRERLGWEQPASGTAELATFRYAIYVDGTRSEIADARCGATAGPGGFECSGRLPAMTPGTHTLELATFFDSIGTIEGAKSPPLRVIVVASANAAAATPLQPGNVVTTADGIKLEAALAASGLNDVVDFALMPDGRIVVAERAGRVRIASGTAVTDALGGGREKAAGDGGILALAVDPERTENLYVIHTPSGGFRVVKYRIAGAALVDRVALLRDVPASAEPSAALRVGPDGKLYAAFDDGGSRDAAARMSDWSGKILRLNSDGGTPYDQPAGSPVFWSGLRSPRGLGWTPDGGTLWMAEQAPEGLERVRALVTGDERPRRAAQRASHPLPQPLGARSLAFHRGGDIREFRGDMFVAGSEAGYLLRVRFDKSDPLRAMSSEKLLEGRIGPVRAVAVSADGSLYVAGESAVWRLARAR